MNDDPLLYERDPYFGGIERQFGLRRGGPLVLSPRDWQRVERWQRKGIPLDAALRGINRAFDQMTASAGRTRRVNSLAYCEPHVMAVWEETRELAAAAGDASAGDPAADHLRLCATTCRRLAAAGAPEPLRQAADALEDLARESGRLAPAELDRRAARIQQVLTAALGERHADLPLPPFSPWAV